MATAVVDESRNEDWVDGVPAARPPLLTRPEALWTLFGLVLLAGFLAFAGFGAAS
jgi:hypothetical protein